jgi:hypothetical protein
MHKPFKFLPEMMTLVSSANIMSVDEVFGVGGRLFIQSMKSKGPKINPSETLCFTVYQFDRVFWVEVII